MKKIALIFSVTVLCVGSANAALLGHWAFDEGSGSTTVNLANPGVGDAVIGEADGAGGITPLDTLWQSNEGRSCIYLTESNFEFANVDAEFTNITTNAVSIAAWVKRQGGNNQAEPIFGKAPTLYGLTIYDSWSSGNLGYVYGYIDSANQGSPVESVVPYEWTHIAMTFDANISGEDNLFIYVNGEVVGSKEISTDIPDTTDLDFRIGGNRVDAPTHEAWNSAYFNGLVDDVWLFDHALTAAEIDELINPAPTFLPGDANKDNTVDVSDLGILATHYGTTEGMEWGNGDFTGDGAVDVSDLGILATNYGTGTEVASSVPEPGMLSLLAIAIAPLCISWRQRG